MAMRGAHRLALVPRTLRFRVLLILLVAFLVTAGVFMWALNGVVMNASSQIESQSVMRDVTRVRLAVEHSAQNMSDATLTWVNARSSATPGADALKGLTPEQLAKLGVEFAVYFNADAVPTGVVAVNPSTGQPVALSAEAIDTLRNAAATIATGPGGNDSGLVLLPAGPAIVSARQIGRSSRPPMPGGNELVMGRYLLASDAADIGSLTQLDVAFDPPARQTDLHLVATAPDGQSNGQPQATVVAATTVLGWTTLPGVDGKPALLVSVREPRTITEQARQMLDYTRLGVSLLAVLVGLCIVVMFEGTISSRLVRLRESVAGYGEEGAPSIEPVVRGEDEIAQLARTMNNKLESIKAAEETQKQRAYHDHLTGLANRRCLEEGAEDILGECARNGDRCTLALLDLDDFKNINDELGHQVGDEVLVWFADRARESLRGDTLVCRLGGDEFAVILPRTDRQGAEIAVQRLRSATAETDESVGYGMVKVRFSVGFSVFPDHGETLEMLTQCADTDLYANKRGKEEDAEPS